MLRITCKSSAFLGATITHLVYFLNETPAYKAAWGWTMTTSADMGFKCKEQDSKGAVGCPDSLHGIGKEGVKPPEGACEEGEKTPCCRDTDFDCTVEPLAKKIRCDVDKITVTCSSDKFTKKQPDMPMHKGMSINDCINIGYEGHPKTSALSWSKTPKCGRAEGAIEKKFEVGGMLAENLQAIARISTVSQVSMCVIGVALGIGFLMMGGRAMYVRVGSSPPQGWDQKQLVDESLGVE